MSHNTPSTFIPRLPHVFAIVFLLMFSAKPGSAQHSMTIPADDTVFFDLDTWRGELQWQVSTNEEDWEDLPGRTSDTIKYVPKEFPLHFRVRMTEGTCEPHYSEVVTVNLFIPDFPGLITRAPANAGPRSFEAGGVIESDGGAPITEQGIVYNTTPAVDLDNGTRVTVSPTITDFQLIVTGLLPDTEYFVRAYATNSAGTAYGGEYRVVTTAEGTYSLGQGGPAGGIVFYDKGFTSDGWRYMEAAPIGWNGESDPWFKILWGCEHTEIGGTSTALGTGPDNTATIMASGCAGSSTAAYIADNLTVGGYDDWFLPSRDELKSLYTNLVNLKSNFHLTYGFRTLTYASSSELDATGAWGYDFAGGGEVQYSKSYDLIAVRPVRRF